MYKAPFSEHNSKRKRVIPLAKNYKNEKKHELKDNKVTSYDPAISGKARGNIRDEEKKSCESSYKPNEQR